MFANEWLITRLNTALSKLWCLLQRHVATWEGDINEWKNPISEDEKEYGEGEFTIKRRRFRPAGWFSDILSSTGKIAAAALGIYLVKFLRLCCCSLAANFFVIFTFNCRQEIRWGQILCCTVAAYARAPCDNHILKGCLQFHHHTSSEDPGLACKSHRGNGNSL